MPGEAALRAEGLDLQPVGAPDRARLQALSARLSRRVHLPVHLLPEAVIELRRLPGREQLDASHLLEQLEARATAESRLLVGVTSEDVAIAVFTFVFGLARQGGRACLVSLARTDPRFYGLPPSPELDETRAVCEILHELGHLAALDHCERRTCLMSFAGNIEKVDTRGGDFCPDCAGRLPRWMASPG